MATASVAVAIAGRGAWAQRPETVARIEAPPATSIVGDASTLFWGTESRIVAQPRNGSPARVLASSEEAPRAIVLSGDRVVWWTSGGNLRSIERSGGTARTIASTSVPATWRFLLAAEGPWIYFGDGNGKLVRGRADGSELQTLASDLALADVMTAARSRAYVATTDGKILSIGADGLGPREVWSGAPVATLASDGEHLYWTTRGMRTRTGGAVGVWLLCRVRLAGGKTEVLADSVHAHDLTAAGQVVLWAWGPQLWSLPAAGGEPTLVAQASDVLRFTWDGRALLFTDRGRLLRLPLR